MVSGAPPLPWLKYVDFVGPFLVMGMAVGSVFYIAVYYGTYYLPIPFSPSIDSRLRVGAVAGYIGAGIIGAVAGYFAAGIIGAMAGYFASLDYFAP